MTTTLEYKENKYNIERYPKTMDTSLRAWSNAEILTLNYLENISSKKIHLYNDRFGVWNCCLHQHNPTTIITYASQKKAILQNLTTNNLNTNINFKSSLETLNKTDLALIKIPKSNELFELFIKQIHKASHKDTEVICCFMTKYFSKSILKIASKYFELSEQTKAWKKARLLILKKPIENIFEEKLINTIEYNNTEIKQYYGVFSSDKIDIATQFLLKNFTLEKEEKNVLDLASGNGIIAHQLHQKNPGIKTFLLDDFNLAIASSKINLKNVNATYIWDNNLKQLEANSFDLVISNPPFHFEHENNIEITISLFNEVKDILITNKRFVLVANKHLNYKTHLERIFKTVKITKENSKFCIYQCVK